MPPSTVVSWLTLAAVGLGWLLFVLAFAFRPRSPAPTQRRQDTRSRVGILVQGVGYACVWALQRPFGTTIVPASRLGALLLLALAATLALFGAWLASAAVRALGRQWSLTARVVEEHALITTGPYAIVRHPIYTSMFLLLVATGVALSHWIGLLLGAAVFVAGTVARIRVEDRLLSQELGEPYRQYAARVPALFPWPRKPAV